MHLEMLYELEGTSRASVLEGLKLYIKESVARVKHYY